MRAILKVMLVVLFTGAAIGCSDSDKSSGGAGAAAWVNWENIPAQFNPNMDERFFDLQGEQRIRLDLFGFNNDVRVIYSSDQPKGVAVLKVYKVYKNQASWGNITTDKANNDKDIVVKNYGSYKCSIKVENGNIQHLDGGCIVRVELMMPTDVPVEVYNLNQRLTPMYFAVSNEDLLENLKTVFTADKKLAMIDDFLNSYTATKQTPFMLAVYLQDIIEDFSFGDDKLEVLRKLQATIVDRENLPALIKKNISYFDQEEAFQIVGLPMN